MKEVKNMKRVLALLTAIIIITGCTINDGSGDDGQGNGGGSLSVNLGFGAATSSGYICKGSGTVTITAPGGATQSQQYSFFGNSSSTSPACRTAVTFSQLEPGSWLVQESATGVSCRKQVAAGQLASVSIRTDVGACQ
jgi:hypothetical protein